MIVTRLWGGLGNQMFQYAFGFSKAKELNTELVLDTRFYTDDFISENPRFTKQKLNLFLFPIDYKKTINEHKELSTINMMQKHRINQFLRVPYYSVWPADNGLKYVKETRMRFQPILASMNKDNRYYDGYWQSAKYFEKYREDILMQYSYTSERADEFIRKNGANCSNAISLHMRMGDYGHKHLTAHHNYVINPEYYIRAIEKAKMSISNPRFFIFSNNISKAEELLGNNPDYVYVSSIPGMKDLDEFSIMCQCPNHIISNSTFSWWAAWLGSHDESINIAPNIVFGNRDIIPDGWMKIEAN